MLALPRQFVSSKAHDDGLLVVTRNVPRNEYICCQQVIASGCSSPGHYVFTTSTHAMKDKLVKHKTHLSAVGGRHCAANFLNRELRHIERSSHNEQGLFPNHKPATQQGCQNQSNAQNSALEVACPLAGLVRALHFDEQHC